MSSRCTLISDQTDDVVQLLLGGIALTTLYGKWFVEIPRRPFRVWFLDALKQGASAAMMHVLNIILAISTAKAAIVRHPDECAFYFLNFVIDTTIGVYIAFHLLRTMTLLAVRTH